MKQLVTLMGLVILASFFLGFAIFDLKTHFNVTPEDRFQIAELIESFEKTNEPRRVVDLSDFYGNYPGQEALLSPAPHFDYASPIVQNRNDFFSKRNCFKYLGNIASLRGVTKVLIWEEYRCGLRSRIPNFFFTYYPFIHPSGHSYAYLFSRYNENLKKESGFEVHNSLFFYFKLGELNEVFGSRSDRKKLNFEKLFLLENAEDIEQRNFPVIDSDNIYFKQGKSNRLAGYSYRRFKRYVEMSRFNIVEYRDDRNCFYRSGKICWSYSLKHLLRLTDTTRLIIITAIILVFVVIVLVIVAKLKADRFEKDQRQLAFRILGHELRTPIASLLLRMEKILSQVDHNLPVYEEIVGVSGDVHRLHRLSEMSKSYLNVIDTKGKVNVEPKEIPSISEFIEDIVYDYEKVTVTLAGEDFAIKTDPYWFSIIITNLVRNAVRHGKPPVEIKVEKNKNKEAVIQVSDHGELSSGKLEDLIRPFNKGESSEGLGLGLNIVSSLVAELGGRLGLEKNPTTFSLTIPIDPTYAINGK